MDFVSTIVMIEVPFLVGIYFLNIFVLVLDFQCGRIYSPAQRWSLPMEYNSGHEFLKRKERTDINGRTADLQKLHKKFFRPSAGKQFNMLTHARPGGASRAVRQKLRNISASCPDCAELHVTSFRVLVYLLEDQLQFHRAISMNPMWFDGRPLIHVVYCDTRFQNAAFMKDKSTRALR